MSKEEAIKQFKNYFPDGVEAMVLTKEDYDRQLGKLQNQNIELQERIDKAIEYIENEAITENLHTDHTYITIQKDELLDILKGNYDKEQ